MSGSKPGTAETMLAELVHHIAEMTAAQNGTNRILRQTVWLQHGSVEPAGEAVAPPSDH
jgi:hypothetical protein